MLFQVKLAQLRIQSKDKLVYLGRQSTDKLGRFKAKHLEVTDIRKYPIVTVYCGGLGLSIFDK